MMKTMLLLYLQFTFLVKFMNLVLIVLTVSTVPTKSKYTILYYKSFFVWKETQASQGRNVIVKNRLIIQCTRVYCLIQAILGRSIVVGVTGFKLTISMCSLIR